MQIKGTSHPFLHPQKINEESGAGTPLLIYTPWLLHLAFLNLISPLNPPAARHVLGHEPKECQVDGLASLKLDKGLRLVN